MRDVLPRERNPGVIDSFLQGGNFGSGIVSVLHGDELDGSINIYDEVADKVWSLNGSTQIDTAQSVFGGSSIFFNGTTDHMNSNSHVDYFFGTGDFTIDLRLRIGTLPGVGVVFADWRDVDGLFPTLFFTSANKLAYFTNGSTRITGTTTLVTNTWYHVALTRSGTNTRLFLNGTQEGSTYVDSNNYTVGTNRPRLGAQGITPTTVFLHGWIDEFRVSKGVATWTSNFTPPAFPYGPIIV